MPNICDNTLKVIGITEDQAAFISKAFADKNFPNAFVPEPDWSTTPNEAGELPTLNENGIHTFPDGTSDDRWYDWRIETWGDKWTASLFGKIDNFSTYEDGTLCVEFQTAWSPYEEQVWEALSRFVPDAEIQVFYEERGCDFCGAGLVKNGEYISKTFEYSALMNAIAETPEGIEQLEKYLEDVDRDDEDEREEALNEWWNDYGADNIKEVQVVIINKFLRGQPEMMTA